MLIVKLPKELEKEHNLIKNEFDKICDDWMKYDDGIIPEDKKYAKRIIAFVVGVTDYVINNYNELNVVEYQRFLNSYYSYFYYGFGGDDNNYLDFDETLDGKSTVVLFKYFDDYKQLPLSKLEKIKSKFSKLLDMF